MFAARATVSGEPEVQLREEMTHMGFSEQAIETAIAAEDRRRKRDEDETVTEIHQDNFESVRLFAALGTQWRHAGLNAVRTGIDYAAIRPTAEALRIELSPERFQDIRTMEAAAIEQMVANHREGRP